MKDRSKRTVVSVIMLIFLTIFASGCSEKESSKYYIEAYNSILEETLNNSGRDKINYGYGYLNEDDIPELFVITSNSHIDGVSVYTFSSKDNTTKHIGNFGSDGSCRFIPRQGEIISQYGNMGEFYFVVSKLTDDGSVILKECLLRDGAKELKSYFGFSFRDFNGSFETYEDKNKIQYPDEKYLISENAADEIERILLQDSVYVDILYCDKVFSK